ncbi:MULTISPECIES: LysR family transcriptional regulator [unclassified Pseudoalteromonas]|uniref:LysR family transcriptional regulator n=1 Tax=unclassified Pseudoalteromonas TaxID=194690 RepID=UPI000B3C7BCF|nr:MULTISPECIES: LysR family transcriptional regulator [unclassified Pseudoalteromonas]MDN3377813.1 LysR family transcriptional regulator [Pseudoalteromonas sp. APC 3893]MDN3386009.1 LysR family transcriptional regulator [Pseudoalteromonas sp. APC 4017]OUS69182.1 LysR family transcriptional regulator [Pseudoalteromonas sp. A601]
MTMKVKTEDLEAFLSVVDAGSFSAAARILDVQVAKVSRSVNRLEQTLQTTLLNRTTRRIELTQEGHVYREFAREGINQILKGSEALSLLDKKPAGRLKVDAASPFVLHQITPLIAGFNEVYPDITLDLASADNIHDLLEYKTDVAIRIGYLKDSNLHARLLGNSKLYLVASPQYLARNGSVFNTDDLNKHKLIGFSNNKALNQWPLKNLPDLRFSITASSGETIRQLCLEHQGLALLSNFMINKDIAAGRLVQVLTSDIISPNPRETVNAVYYKNSAVSSRITAFLDFIQPKLTL